MGLEEDEDKEKWMRRRGTSIMEGEQLEMKKKKGTGI